MSPVFDSSLLVAPRRAPPQNTMRGQIPSPECGGGRPPFWSLRERGESLIHYADQRSQMARRFYDRCGFAAPPVSQAPGRPPAPICCESIFKASFRAQMRIHAEMVDAFCGAAAPVECKKNIRALERRISGQAALFWGQGEWRRMGRKKNAGAAAQAPSDPKHVSGTGRAPPPPRGIPTLWYGNVKSRAEHKVAKRLYPQHL